MAPKIDRRNMRDLTLTANSMLKFDVGIIGEPPPTAVWTVSGNPIKWVALNFSPFKNCNVLFELLLIIIIQGD